MKISPRNYNQLAAATLLMSALSVVANAEQPNWVSPKIKQAPVVDLPQTGPHLQASETYRVVMDVTKAGGADKLLPGLIKAGRILNLAKLDKLPDEQIKIVLLIRSKAASRLLNHQQYREAYQQDNPNIELINALHREGVIISVCGQALAGQGIDPRQLATHVDIAPSALTSTMYYQQQGYISLSD